MLGASALQTLLLYVTTLTCFAWLCMIRARWQRTWPAGQSWTGHPAQRPPHPPCPGTSGDSAVTPRAAGSAGQPLRPGRTAASGRQTRGSGAVAWLAARTAWTRTATGCSAASAQPHTVGSTGWC